MNEDSTLPSQFNTSLLRELRLLFYREPELRNVQLHEHYETRQQQYLYLATKYGMVIPRLSNAEPVPLTNNGVWVADSYGFYFTYHFFKSGVSDEEVAFVHEQRDGAVLMAVYDFRPYHFSYLSDLVDTYLDPMPYSLQMQLTDFVTLPQAFAFANTILASHVEYIVNIMTNRGEL